MAFITFRGTEIVGEGIESNNLANWKAVELFDISVDKDSIKAVQGQSGDEFCKVVTMYGLRFFVAESRESVIEKINKPDESKPRRRFEVA